VTHLKPAESALTVKKCEAMKATNVVILFILMSDDTEPGSDGLSENRTPDLCRCRHNNTTTKNDRKLQIFTTENHLPITVLFCNVSDQLFKM